MRVLQFLSLAFWAAVSLTSSAMAASSSEIVKSHTRATYSFIKSVVADEQKKPESKNVLSGPNISRSDAEYELEANFDECGLVTESILSTSYHKYSDSNRLFILAILAMDVTSWARDFSKIGYPKAVWASRLQTFEEKQLHLIEGLSEQQLKNRLTDQPVHPASVNDAYSSLEKSYREDVAKDIVSGLNSYRSTTKAAIPKIVMGGPGCGAGGLTVTISTEPKGGQINVIPVFFYKLCKSQPGVNVDDPSSCDRWREIPDGFSSQMAGDYFYNVRWPNGLHREGTLLFNSMGDGDKKKIVLRPMDSR